MRKKKILILLMSLTLFTLLLNGCDNTSADDSASRDTTAITVVITHKDGTINTQEYDTSAKYLSDALDEMGILDANSDQDGFYTTVDGESADTDAEEWWCLTIDGESAITGLKETELEDGKSYELTFTEGW